MPNVGSCTVHRNLWHIDRSSSQLTANCVAPGVLLLIRMDLMQTTTTFETGRQLGCPPANLQFESWPLRDGGRNSWITVFGIVVVAISLGFVAQSLYLSVLGLAAIAAAMWRMWIPIRYELGPKGITQRILGRQLRIPWSAIRRGEVRQHGVLIMSKADDSLRSKLNGTYVRWEGHREQVLAIVAYYLGSRLDPQLEQGAS